MVEKPIINVDNYTHGSLSEWEGLSTLETSERAVQNAESYSFANPSLHRPAN